jgi:hypothetical protein
VKKPPKSAGSEQQSLMQKMHQCTHQIGKAYKHGSVFLPEAKKPEAAKSERSAPKGKLRRKLKPGQPHARSKLTAELRERICGYVADGMSWQEAAALCGIHRDVVTDWKARGDAEPQSAYGEFLRAAERAKLKREHTHLAFISQDKDWKARRWLLCNWRPDKYRMNIFSGELTGKDGLALFFPQDNSFEVKLELHAPGELPEPAESSRSSSQTGRCSAGTVLARDEVHFFSGGHDTSRALKTWRCPS